MNFTKGDLVSWKKETDLLGIVLSQPDIFGDVFVFWQGYRKSYLENVADLNHNDE